mgnify:CR=1 FL=1
MAYNPDSTMMMMKDKSAKLVTALDYLSDLIGLDGVDQEKLDEFMDHLGDALAQSDRWLIQNWRYHHG